MKQWIRRSSAKSLLPGDKWDEGFELQVGEERSYFNPEKKSLIFPTASSLFFSFGFLSTLWQKERDGLTPSRTLG